MSSEVIIVAEADPFAPTRMPHVLLSRLLNRHLLSDRFEMAVAVVTRTLVIKNPQGLHARPAEMFARTAMKFDAHVEVVHLEQRVDAKSILHLLTLGANQGTTLLLEARGADAQQAVDALAQLVDAQFADEGTMSQEQTG